MKDKLYIGAQIITPSGFHGVIKDIDKEHGYAAADTGFGTELFSITKKIKLTNKEPQLIQHLN